MGGDKAPDVNIKGALLALAKETNLKLLLVGPQATIRHELKKHGGKESDRLSIIHAEETISMEDHGASVIRKKKKSSIHVGLNLVKESIADGFISAGNSGAVMAGAALILGRVAEVERPAILVRLPTVEGFVIILDAGANVDCRGHHLVQFAEMGHVYAEVIERIERPKIGILSNGSEAHKGNDLTREADALIRKMGGLNYIGYVEGHDIFRKTADVVVADGFVGNVILKGTEGLADTAFDWFRTEIKKDWIGLLGVVLMRNIFKKFKEKFDYQPYGAAPLLGVNGMVMISHGGSTDIAIRNGILTAKHGVEQNFTAKIKEQLEKVQLNMTATENNTPS